MRYHAERGNESNLPFTFLTNYRVILGSCLLWFPRSPWEPVPVFKHAYAFPRGARERGTVLPRRSDFGEHVFVQITFGVAIFHGDGVDHIDDLIQQGGVGDNEHRVFHETGIGTTRPTIQRLDKGKHLIPEHIELALRLEILETRPAQVALTFFKNGIVNLFTQ